MNVNDLRSALHEQADTVTDHDAAQRVVQVHARVRVARHRRVAGVAALTVGVLAMVGAVSILPNRGADTASADLSDPAVQEKFVSHSGEFDLIAAKVGEPGQNTLELTVPAHRGEIYVSMLCNGLNGPSGGYWVSGYLGDTRPDRPDSTWCGGDTPAIPGVHGVSPGPWGYETGPTVQAGGHQLTVHIELTQEVDENGALLDKPDEVGVYVPASNPDAVISVAVYSVAPPVTTVAGTKIRPLVGLDGQDYAYEDHRESQPGDRTLTWTLEPSTSVRYYDFVASNAMDQPNGPGLGVEATLDETTCLTNYGLAQFRAGGCLLSAGKPHTITLTIEDDVPPDALMGIVLYRQAG